MSRSAPDRRLLTARPRLERLEDRDTPATLLAGFDTIDAAQNISLGGGSVPPDSHGTAGRDHVVTIVNTTVAWYTKAGVQQAAMTLDTFFAPLAVGGQPFGNFDPKVIYDPFRDRFVAMTLDSNSTTYSRILVAVSKTADPNDGWNYQAINSFLTIGGNTYWTDYPGLSLDENAVYFTGNPFATGAGAAVNSRLWVMDKQVYGGGTSAVNVYDPWAGTGLTSGTTQPAVLQGVRPAGTNGTYLVSYMRNTGIGGAAANDEARVIRVDDPLTAPSFTLTRINLGDIDNAPNPVTQPLLQPAGIFLDGGDQRVYNAAWRNGTLVFANTVTPPTGADAGQPTVNLMAVDTSGGTPVLIRQMNVGGEDLAPATGTSYGTVAINAAGVVGVGFSASGPALMAGAFFTSVDVRTGVVQPSSTSKVGQVGYANTYGTLTTIGGIPVTRWGDYSATVVDPTDDNSFWTFNEYSKDLPGVDGNWGNYASHFRVQTQYYAVGADAGGGPNVKVFDYGGSLRFSFNAYAPSYTGGVRVALADVNGDQIPDIITATGQGGGPNVKVFDGRNLNVLYSFFAYDPKYTAGLYVAAGDVDGDGLAEIVTGADTGGGPNVRVFKLGANGQVTLASSFYAYAAGFTGGVRVAVGDYDNDGAADIITSPGFGGGPHVEVFDGRAAAVGKAVLVKSFMAGSSTSNSGAYVAVGNLNGDGVLDFVVGSGAGFREVRVYDGRTLAFLNGFNVLQPGTSAPQVTGTTAPVGELLGGVGLPNQLPTDTTQTPAVNPTRPFAGLRVAVADIDNDGNDDIIAIGGPGDQPLLRIRNGKSMTTLGSDRLVFNSAFLGGAFVAASR